MMTVNKLLIEVQNQGDGIAYCTSYIDLTNLDYRRAAETTSKELYNSP